METYIVQYEDRLEKIAEKKLGNTKRWYEIAQSNNIESHYSKPAGFDQYRDRNLTYFLNKREIDELVKLMLKGY